MDPIAPRRLVEFLIALAAALILWRSAKSVGWRRRSGEAGPLAGRSRVLGGTALALAVGLGLTAVAVDQTFRDARSDARSKFDRLADRLAREAQRRGDLPLYALRGARGLFAASKSVERAEFHAFVVSRDIHADVPGVRGVGYVRRVMREDLPGFVASEQADGAPDFAVHSRSDAPDFFVVSFMEPMERSRLVWGADIGSKPDQHAAIERAMWTGEPTIVAGVALPNDEAGATGLLYLVPVYRNGLDPRTAPQREAALTGFVVAWVAPEDALAGVDAVADGMLDFDVFDGDESIPERQIFDSNDDDGAQRGAADRSAADERLFDAQSTIVVAGRTLTLRISTLPRFEAATDHASPTLVGLAGGLLSALLAAVVWLLGRGRARALDLAREMTFDLASAKDRAESALREAEALRSTLDAQAITSVSDTSGRIIPVNDIFCRISGYLRDQLV